MDITVIIRNYWPVIVLLGSFAAWALISWLKDVFLTTKNFNEIKKKTEEDLSRQLGVIEGKIKFNQDQLSRLQERMTENDNKLNGMSRDYQELKRYGSDSLRKLEEDVRNDLTRISKDLDGVSLKLDFMIKQARRRDRP